MIKVVALLALNRRFLLAGNGELPPIDVDLDVGLGHAGDFGVDHERVADLGEIEMHTRRAGRRLAALRAPAGNQLRIEHH